jgi:hypothetical protein
MKKVDLVKTRLLKIKNGLYKEPRTIPNLRVKLYNSLIYWATGKHSQ